MRKGANAIRPLDSDIAIQNKNNAPQYIGVVVWQLLYSL